MSTSFLVCWPFSTRCFRLLECFPTIPLRIFDFFFFACARFSKFVKRINIPRVFSGKFNACTLLSPCFTFAYWIFTFWHFFLHLCSFFCFSGRYNTFFSNWNVILTASRFVCRNTHRPYSMNSCTLYDAHVFLGFRTFSVLFRLTFFYACARSSHSQTFDLRNFTFLWFFCESSRFTPFYLTITRCFSGLEPFSQCSTFIFSANFLVWWAWPRVSWFAGLFLTTTCCFWVLQSFSHFSTSSHVFLNVQTLICAHTGFWILSV